MRKIELAAFEKKVKKERATFYKTSFERAYDSFCELGLDKKNSEYFRTEASAVVEIMRNKCWESFLEEEREFTINTLHDLIDKEESNKLEPIEAIKKYTEAYMEHIYSLSLSSTQSRRSRAGKEFEEIIALILMGAGVSLDSQGNIGKESFVKKGLGKLVDAVSPGVVEFEINKRNTALISAKTTLRERWQEVPEEMGRTGAREMFLATLDEKISQEVLNTLYEANIQVTTTKANKDENYANNSRVLTFEELIGICLNHSEQWDSYEYSNEQLTQVVELLEKQIIKYEKHEYVGKTFEKRLGKYQEKLTQL